MSNNTSSNKAAVPEAKGALNRFKFEVANELGVPAENPEAVIYVIIDEPHVEDQAHSTYATEFASKIMKKILPFLGIYAENTDDVAKADSTAEPTAEPAATQDRKSVV